MLLNTVPLLWCVCKRYLSREACVFIERQTTTTTTQCRPVQSVREKLCDDTKKKSNLFFLLELLENLHTPQFAGPLSDYRDNFSIKQVFPVIFTVPKFSIRSTQCTWHTMTNDSLHKFLFRFPFYLFCNHIYLHVPSFFPIVNFKFRKWITNP